MSNETIDGQRNSQMQEAIASLERLVRSKYPAAVFEVAEGHDPAGTYLWATVDVADTDEIMDLVIDRLLDLQVEQGIPLYFIPLRPFEQVAQELRRDRRRRSRLRGHAALGSETGA